MQIRLKRMNARLLSVIDGDTVDVELFWWSWCQRKHRQERIRFAGIDTPEMKPTPEPYAQEAVEFVRKHLTQKIRVEFAIHKKTGEWIRESVPWDRKRLIGIVYAGRKNINCELVRHGLAKLYPTPTWMTSSFHASLTSSLRQAQKKKRGLWRVPLQKRRQMSFFFWVWAGFVVCLVLSGLYLLLIV